MALDRAAATARIGRQLADAEQMTDAALLAASELMTTLIRARGDAEVAPHTGQTALIRLANAQQSLIQGSNEVFRVHDVLAKIGIELGLLDEPNSTPKFGLSDDNGINRDHMLNAG